MEDLHLARAIWKKFSSLIHSLKTHSISHRGRPRVNIRRVFLGICFLLWSGSQWRALPRKYGARSTVHRYFVKWAKIGLFQRLWKITLAFLDQRNRIKKDIHIVDGSQVLVQSLPRSVAFLSPKYRPKRAIKLSLLIDSKGTPLATSLESANQHDVSLLDHTLNQNLNHTQIQGKTVLLGDKGYVGGRQDLTAIIHGYQPIFHPRKYHLDQLKASKRRILKQHRWKVERTISWLKSLRRIKHCYERSFESYQAFLDLGCLMISFRKIYL